MNQKEIKWFGNTVTLACDAACQKAWGISNRPEVSFDENEPDDTAYLSDAETAIAPVNPGTYEGGQAKPHDASLNKWCARECERSVIVRPGEVIHLPDFSVRRYNQPWKHAEVTK